MKRILLVMIALLVCSFMSAQEGIQFKKCSWNEALEVARKENKIIFIDFYTEWCGPCYNMAQQVFVLHSVGSFYNSNFISLKIDAEKGEGVELALKYNVRSYPTYVFVDPDTGEEIHRSSGRQDAETFLFTGKSALTPQLRSGYLFKTFEQGCSEVDFLLNYAMYMGSIFNSKRVGEICNQLWESGSCTLENEKMWNLFVKYVKGLENPWFKSMLESVDKLRGLYGKESVDAKLYEETKYEKVKENILSLPDFEGKDVVLMYNDYDSAFRAKNYAEAASSLDALMAYSGALDREVCKFLYYAGRSNLYEEFPDNWHDKCLEVSKFVAYNHPDRSDASIHQLYAMQLEMWAKRMNVKIPSSSLGIQEYYMRPKDLMAKPKR